MLMLMPMPHVEFFFRCRSPACLSLSACPLPPPCVRRFLPLSPATLRIHTKMQEKAVDDRQWMRGGFDAKYAMDFADSSSMEWLLSPVLAGKKPRQDQGLGTMLLVVVSLKNKSSSQGKVVVLQKSFFLGEHLQRNLHLGPHLFELRDLFDKPATALWYKQVSEQDTGLQQNTLSKSKEGKDRPGRSPVRFLHRDQFGVGLTGTIDLHHLGNRRRQVSRKPTALAWPTARSTATMPVKFLQTTPRCHRPCPAASSLNGQCPSNPNTLPT
ncbi:uncharacterized protein BDZ83DRAFT_653868 [Colletotrichum acutatum]|uniref:Uncharacterized protein n=1 Tax=Glomerella acutata TaxID=27357 RepID=A0AAD8UJR1_GLOAC|nr:uncharacterized protein BDZ83DRAFT_653868 [Colletotrichum acutatum]KAK1722514.1 hypothetical protein BDZ83DRAFT_653868 [Colletotrichum acutatum]